MRLPAVCCRVSAVLSPAGLVILVVIAVYVSLGAEIRQKPEIASQKNLGFTFTNIAREAGLNARTVFGGEHSNTYLLETTGTGVAAFDYDGDGWLDIFLVNGTVLEGFPRGQEPTNHLYRNKGNGTFEDVTA